jgi:endonuclease/exonuclease/phosphatase family metal-dependent hydrolase
MVYQLRKWGWMSLLLILPAWKNASTVFGTHPFATFQIQKKSKDIRILSWNVNAFLYRPYQGPESKEDQDSMIHFIQKMNADILCLQDFSETPSQYGKVNIAFLADSLNYPYRYFSQDGINYGTILFSRLPITDSGRTKYTDRVYPESIAYIDVKKGNDTLRVYNTHFRSMNLHQEYFNKENIGYLEFVKEDTAVLFHSNRLGRMMYFDCIHTAQAALVKQKLLETKKSFIFCADLNSVPSSFVYHNIHDGLVDPFLTNGWGWGVTYSQFSPSLRIDVMLMSKDLHATQYFSPRMKLSDHYPIITDIQVQN